MRSVTGFNLRRDASRRWRIPTGLSNRPRVHTLGCDTRKTRCPREPSISSANGANEIFALAIFFGSLRRREVGVLPLAIDGLETGGPSFQSALHSPAHSLHAGGTRGQPIGTFRGAVTDGRWFFGKGSDGSEGATEARINATGSPTCADFSRHGKGRSREMICRPARLNFVAADATAPPSCNCPTGQRVLHFQSGGSRIT
ncbi:hypothetical protein B0G84_8273 [Paraburkholderia sp. BL8N3]|nr:hypothetical protein B0G84_8273 [Paraburkholderia sp. BL8N3]